ncbi:MAG: sulfite exporter TauE/SafE family protein [Verrucomicrobia bacterium]|nr:sulfite exporter TauE/SafE family protein [Verrucomicrobiota bacterium]
MVELNPAEWIVLCLGSLVIALLYSSVGHGGATGYLTLLALAGVLPDPARTCALITNCFVASLAWYRFHQAGHFDRRILLPLVVTSIPAAWLGSRLIVPLELYQLLLGFALLASAVALVLRPDHIHAHHSHRARPWPVALGLGAALGFLAGLTGIGGGVFLSPLLLFFRWTPTKTTGGIAAAFIVLNSLAGLVGLGSRVAETPPWLAAVTLAAIAGALIGVYLGARRWSDTAFRWALACVLLLAGAKLGLTGGSVLWHRSHVNTMASRPAQSDPLPFSHPTH